MERIENEINKGLQNSYYEDEDGNLIPYVCMSCDKNLRISQVTYVSKEDMENRSNLFEPKRDLHDDVLSYYTYDGSTNSTILRGCLFSPRSLYNKRKQAFVLCKDCRYDSLTNNRTPKFAISNYFEIGSPPTVLKDLTDVELAFISDVRFHVHFLTFRGGHAGIQGWHSLIKTNLSDKVNTLNALEQSKTLPNKICVVMYGYMTEKQKQQIKKISRIRRDKCQEAIDWLCKNHSYYKKIAETIDWNNVPEIIFVDESKQVQSVDSNLESQESIQVVIPDITLDKKTGGLSSVEELDEIIGSKLFGGTVEAHVQLSKSDYVQDFADNNLTLAFPLQFPYGYGGPTEVRELNDGTRRKLFADEYFSHITNLSRLDFQKPLIILVAFNIYFRSKMMQKSFWRVAKENVSNISTRTADDVLKELQNMCERSTSRIRNVYRETTSNSSMYIAKNKTSDEFLALVSSVSTALPHSREAAKTGRSNLFSLQFTFGRPNIFFTVSPNDSNSLIITVYSGHEKYLAQNSDLSYDRIKENCNMRSQLRFKYPGLSTFNFEIILQLVVKHIIGWSSAMDVREGYFGIPKAYFYTVEEQARKVLHAHFVIWIQDCPVNYQLLESDRTPETKRARIEISAKEYFEKVQSSCILGNEKLTLNHACVPGSRQLTSVAVKSDQELRDLRHQKGCTIDNGAVFYCERCKHQWTSIEGALTNALCKNLYFKRYVNSLRCNDISRLQIKTLDLGSNQLKELSHPQIQAYLKDVANELIYKARYPGFDQSNIVNVADALYNVHSSRHVRTCFSESKPECRYKFPKLASSKTCISYESKTDRCYDHNGKPLTNSRFRMVPKRGKYDIFSNTSCPLVTKTFFCNSNVQVIQDPMSGFYISKYCSKDTQKDDAYDYSKMRDLVTKRLICRKYEDDDRREALSRIIGFSLAHNSFNIVSATLAKYLIDKGSRFGMSHDVRYIPIVPLKCFLKNESIGCTVLSSSDNTSNENKDSSSPCFVNADAMHYINRPARLSHLSVLQFFTEYIVCNQSNTKNINIEKYNFPKSYAGSEFLIIKKRIIKAVAGISNWTFPDTACFEGCNILDKEIMTNANIEEYCMAVLILLVPFRNINDITCNSSYLAKYRQCYDNYIKPCKHYLENMQDLRNAKRFDIAFDELECLTVPFDKLSNEKTDDDLEDFSEVDDPYDKVLIDSFLSSQWGEVDKYSTMRYRYIQETPHPVNENGNMKIPNINFDAICNRGKQQCGYQRLSPSDSSNKISQFVINQSSESNDPRSSNGNTNSNNDTYAREKTTLSKLASTLRLTITRRKLGNMAHIANEEPETTQQQSLECVQSLNNICCNGTAASIVAWARKKIETKKGVKQLDKHQQNACVVILSHFVLTYIEEADDDLDCLVDTTNEDNEETQTRNDNDDNNCVNEETPQTKKDNDRKLTRRFLRKQKNDLKRLSGGVGEYLRLYLDGPGGSGKSEIIHEVLEYARNFCYELETSFTKYTILVTASTGVAATLIRGQTVHKACMIDRESEQQINQNATQPFDSVRLIILDEISMVSQATLTKLDNKLRRLRPRKSMHYYGGIHMVFVGDFRQLPPVGRGNAALYLDRTFHPWFSGVNLYIELLGRYRFKDDPEWGAILDRFHRGTPKVEDFLRINERVIQPGTNRTKDGTPLPPGIKYCTHTNLERDAINTGLFLKKVRQSDDLSDILLIFSDSIKILENKKPKKYVPMEDPRQFYEECSENSCQFPTRSTTRMDPVLKLYSDSRIMLTNNWNVEEGLANGTSGLVKQIRLKPNITPFQVEVDNKEINAVFASEVEHVRFHVTSINKTSEVCLSPQMHTFEGKFDKHDGFGSTRNLGTFNRGMKANQIPFIHNDATTGHKLQGSSLLNILINNFFYGENWAYVALSRVSSLKGLFLQTELKMDKNYSVDARLTSMKNIFRTQKSLPDVFLDYVDQLILQNNGATTTVYRD